MHISFQEISQAASAIFEMPVAYILLTLIIRRKNDNGSFEETGLTFCFIPLHKQ